MNTVEIDSRPLAAHNDDELKAPSFQGLLDVISSIIAEEYIMVAKQNPMVFSKIAAGTSCPRNDTL